MKTAKKSAVLLLALAMVLAFFGLTASAEELTFGDYSYVILEDGSVKITAYNGAETAVTVPDTIEEKAVTVIGAGAFDQKETIESLVIPGSVAELETGAVSFCPRLESITVQEGQLQQIGSSDVKNCVALKTVSIPSNVSEIGTFAGCTALENITVAAGNKSLKNLGGIIYSTDMKTLIKVPQACKRTELHIPTSITKIADKAFYEVSSPMKLYIPLTLKELEGLPFAYSKVSLYYEGSTVPAAWKEAVEGFSFTVNGFKLRATDKITSTPGGNSINLKWNSVYGANCYSVYYKSGTKWKKLADVKSTSYTVNGTKYGTKYTFAVKAGKTSGGKTVWTDVYTTHTVTAKIPATAKVTSTQTASSITLSWNAVKGVDGYKIYYKTGSGWKALGNVTKTSVTYKNLKAGSKYTFAVKAGKKVSGKVMWSDVYTTHVTATKPAKPAKVTASQTTNSLTLNWSAVSGATGYRIYYKKGNTWAVSKDSVTGTTHTFKGLASGQKFTLAVRSYIKGDSGVIWGDYITCNTAVKPGGTDITVTSPAIGEINVKWNAVPRATEYRLYYKKNNDAYKLYKTYGASVRSASFKDLAGGDTYTFAVRAGVSTSDGVILSDYTPKSVTLKYRTPRYLNTFKSGEFFIKYTMYGATESFALSGNNVKIDTIDEVGSSVSLVYEEGLQRWVYLNHTYQVWMYLLMDDVQDMFIPQDLCDELATITVPEKYKTGKATFGGKSCFTESYSKEGITYTYYYNGATLVGIRMKDKAGQSADVTVHNVKNKVDLIFYTPSHYTQIA